MEKARIILFEDHPAIRIGIIRAIERDGHTIRAVATNRQEADTLLAEIDPDSIDVAIVDGNLGSENNGHDGAHIVTVIRECFPLISAIGNSAMGEVAGAHYQALKDGATLRQIIADL